MRKNYYQSQDTAIKILFVCLALLLSGVFFVSGTIASEDCTQYSHSAISPFYGNSILCNACCNTEHSQKNCRNQCSLPFELPKVAVVSNGGAQSDSSPFIADPIKIHDPINNSGRNTHIISKEKTFNFPPIFLQKETFLI